MDRAHLSAWLYNNLPEFKFHSYGFAGKKRVIQRYRAIAQGIEVEYSFPVETNANYEAGQILPLKVLCRIDEDMWVFPERFTWRYIRTKEEQINNLFNPLWKLCK